MKEQEILEAIQRGDREVLNHLYKVYRNDFFQWASQRFTIRQEEMADIFQDAVIALYRNIAQGKLVELRSSIKTYLFGIGKNLILKYLRDQREKLPLEAATFEWDLKLEQQYVDEGIKILLTQAIESLGTPCNQILLLFYYRNFAMQAIQAQLGYKSEAVARAQKKRCMQYLRKRLLEQHKDELR
ncbi:MAG: sigma-70 family RNA polymerase sigma factor [Bacteroidota bacterium]